MNHFSQCKIIENTKVAKDTFYILFSSKSIAQRAKPGQFLHIRIPGDNSLLLRRPISINHLDKTLGRVGLIYQIAGKGTYLLSQLNKGITLDILGPLGNGFHIPYGINNVLVVGGGCGIAPLRFVVEEWKDLSFTTCLGFRDRDSAYLIDEFKMNSYKLLLTSNDGSIGEKGLVTDLVKQELETNLPDLILACGPTPVLKIVQKLAFHYQVPCQISLEERMGCGIGGCLVCSCAIKISKDDWKYKNVCSDGPVFWSQEVIFDE